ncbi:MAG: IPTL-CTERM sorting domain-containing protein, partial [Desulfosalsimonadaceae bacterium]
ATDANGCTGVQAYTIVINAPVCPPITLTPPPLPQGTEDVLYNRTITASGGQAPYTFLVTAGILPTGLSFTNGLISGTPTAPGSFTFTVTATDANGCTGVQAYTIVINAPACPPITLLPTILPAGTVNTAYSQTITGNGGAAPYSFTMTAGTLPAGLSPITAGGLIAGTPTTAGTFTFTVTATDQNGCTGVQAYTIVINAPVCPPITLLPTILPAGTVNSAYSQTITASGGAAPYSFTMTAGTLPAGLSPITAGGVIAGTPTTAGTFTFTVTATDDNGCTGLREYTLVINPMAVGTIPTLSEWGMIIFMTLLGLTSIYYLRRRKVKI